jgi:fructose-1,6-bisphosphatase I
VGTIFSIHRKVSDHPRGCEVDCLQPGYRQVAAGYVVYGSSTMLVYTTGNGVHGFTLEPGIGEFLLSHPNMCIPEQGQRIYSVNEGNFAKWSEGQRRLVEWLKGADPTNPKPFSARYIGSLVADFHRNLLYGGLFMYPADVKNRHGKLRLLYEAAPLAMIAEHAGGAASDGQQRIMDIEPSSLHQRTPLFIGTKEYVELAMQFVAPALVEEPVAAD